MGTGGSQSLGKLWVEPSAEHNVYFLITCWGGEKSKKSQLLEAENQQGRELELPLSSWREKKRLATDGESCWSWAGLFGEDVKGLEEQPYVGEGERMAQIHVTGWLRDQVELETLNVVSCVIFSNRTY